jgi:uncharacterized membrane protein
MRSERGSVLLFGIGLIVVCLLALAVVADVSAVFLQRRALTALADGAALAGAQAIDVDAYYAQGATVGTALSPANVHAAVRSYLDRSGATQAFPGFGIDRIDSGSQVVDVAVQAPARLTFFPEVAGPIRVVGRARLDYRGSG